MQIVMLKVRMQAAQEHHKALVARINAAIELGVQEQADLRAQLPDKTPKEILDQGDYVRQKTLEKFHTMEEDTRPAGSF